jgi:hypothetical protein
MVKKREETSKDQVTRPGWRFRVGLIFFVLGLVCPVFIPLITATELPTKWKAGISGLLALGIPELLWLAAIAVMGKAGFNHIKGRFFSLFNKVAPPDVVSLTRYRFGLGLFLLPLFFGWLVPYAPHLVPGYGAHRFAMNLACDVILILSLFVLGGDFWDKIRSLFMYKAKAQIPESSGDAL